jgi:hypothetical protein
MNTKTMILKSNEMKEKTNNNIFDKNNIIEYKTLSQDEIDDVIVSFLHQQEMDHLCHSINKQRYEKILNDRYFKDDEFKTNIQKLRDEVEVRISQVEKIIEHTREQLPSQERIDAAVERIKEKAELLNRQK